MPTTIEKNANTILIALTQASDSNSQEYISALQIQELTHLNPIKINNAISRLNDQGCVDLIQGLGSHPFIFQSARITHEGLYKVQTIFEAEDDADKLIDKIHYYLTGNKLIVVIITFIFIISALITFLPYINSDNNNPRTLHKLDVHNDQKIIFRAEGGGYVSDYNTTFNIDFNLLTEYPSTLKIYFQNFSKFNNNIQKDYMSNPYNYMNYKVYPEKSYVSYDIEPYDRNRNQSFKFYLENFSISGKYFIAINSPELNFYLGNVTLLINFKDLKYEKEINKTISIPVYWMNKIYRY